VRAAPAPGFRKSAKRDARRGALSESCEKPSLALRLEQRRGDLLGGQHRPALRLLAEVFRPFADACMSRLERA
jgi:hypothetical protein